MACARAQVRLATATNDEAKYNSCIRLVVEAKRRGAARLRVHLDSLLVVNQASGVWGVKSPKLRPLHQRLRALCDEMCRRVLAQSGQPSRHPSRAPPPRTTKQVFESSRRHPSR